MADAYAIAADAIFAQQVFRLPSPPTPGAAPFGLELLLDVITSQLPELNTTGFLGPQDVNDPNDNVTVVPWDLLNPAEPDPKKFIDVSGSQAFLNPLDYLPISDTAPASVSTTQTSTTQTSTTQTSTTQTSTTQTSTTQTASATPICGTFTDGRSMPLSFAQSVQQDLAGKVGQQTCLPPDTDGTVLESSGNNQVVLGTDVGLEQCADYGDCATALAALIQACTSGGNVEGNIAVWNTFGTSVPGLYIEAYASVPPQN